MQIEWASNVYMDSFKFFSDTGMLQKWAAQDISSHMWFPIWHTSTGSYKAAFMQHLYGARAADIKTLLMFLSGKPQTISNIITHVHTNGVCLRLGAASSACFTMPWKSASNQFSLLSQSGSVDYWQQGSYFFCAWKITDCLHVVPTTNWTSRVD